MLCRAAGPRGRRQEQPRKWDEREMSVIVPFIVCRSYNFTKMDGSSNDYKLSTIFTTTQPYPAHFVCVCVCARFIGGIGFHVTSPRPSRAQLLTATHANGHRIVLHKFGHLTVLASTRQLSEAA